ncbi:hypothetical protein QQP08_014645 [Theobroma cacao]|nr:hypothetical protein QQP08_014645 [Theobroma cacao]
MCTVKTFQCFQESHHNKRESNIVHVDTGAYLHGGYCAADEAFHIANESDNISEPATLPPSKEQCRYQQVNNA